MKCMDDTSESVDLFCWWWSSKIHNDGIILMRNRKMAGENLQGKNTVFFSEPTKHQNIVRAPTICNLSLSFFLVSQSSQPREAGRGWWETSRVHCSSRTPPSTRQWEKPGWTETWSPRRKWTSRTWCFGGALVSPNCCRGQKSYICESFWSSLLEKGRCGGSSQGGSIC